MAKGNSRPLEADEIISTGSVVTCAISTVRVTAVLTAASSTNTAVPQTSATSTSTALAGGAIPNTATAATAATAIWAHAIAMAGAAAPARISAPVLSPVRNRLSTSYSRRAT